MKFEFKIKIPKSISIGYGVKINRIDIHKLIQKHAFSLGYEWREKNDQDQKIIQHWDKPGIHLGSDGRIKYYAREKDFKACDCASINCKEFLKLKGE